MEIFWRIEWKIWEQERLGIWTCIQMTGICLFLNKVYSSFFFFHFENLFRFNITGRKLWVRTSLLFFFLLLLFNQNSCFLYWLLKNIWGNSCSNWKVKYIEGSIKYTSTKTKKCDTKKYPKLMFFSSLRPLPISFKFILFHVQPETKYFTLSFD